MIDEIFLQSAVRIRRTYLKMSNNMEFYHKKAQEVLSKLENTITRIDKLKSEIQDYKKSGQKIITSESALSELLEILSDVESEGDRLESLIQPMNKEIEKLSLEEQELYRQIKEKHNNLTEEQIVNSVKERLISEGL